MSKRPSTRAAVLRVQNAMQAVERSQQHLDLALQNMSAVRYGGSTYDALAREYRRVKALWYRLEKLSKRSGLSLDSEPEVHDV